MHNSVSSPLYVYEPGMQMALINSLLDYLHDIKYLTGGRKVNIAVVFQYLNSNEA